MEDRIDFVCARSEHQSSEPNDALTMHQDRWAYCARGAVQNHDWFAVPRGGVSLDEAKRLARPTPVPHPTDSPA
jgi:hypothetical protein